MKILLLLPLFLGLMFPAIAHNEANGGCQNHCDSNPNNYWIHGCDGDDPDETQVMC